MKSQIGELFITLAFLAGFACSANAAVTFTITPAAISNTYSGIITLQISGLTNTETVVVQKFLDANSNGVVDAGDILWQQFQLTDGQASVFTNGTTSVTNFNVPGDTDGSANGSITANLYPAFDFAQEVVGKYLFVLSSPVGHFSPITNSFAVTNFPFAQSFTGNVVSNATSTTLSNAVVILLNPNLSGGPVGGTVANNSGAYTIKMPPGTYELLAVKSNFVANGSTAPFLNLSAGATITTNLTLASATQSISGKLVDANNSSIGLSGVLMSVQTQNGGSGGGLMGLLTLAFTDTNGNFSAQVVPGQWEVGGNDAALATKGYLSVQNKLTVDTTTGSVSGVTVALPRATAIFYGTLKDNSGNPLPGVTAFYSSDNNGNYETDGYTYTNGNYVAGAVVGLSDDPWQISEDYSILTNYIISQPSFDQNGGTNLHFRQAVQVNFTALQATNSITGNVQDSDGNPIAGVGVNANATINNVSYNASIDTGSNGNYSLAVANGDWSVSVNCNGGSDSLENIYTNGNFECPNNQFININSANGTVDFIVQLAGGQIFGYVVDNNGNPVSGVTVSANDGMGDTYTTNTANSGYYSISVGNGNWDVSVDCANLNSQGYECVSDDNVGISDNNAEANFTAQLSASPPVFSFVTLYAFSTGAYDANSDLTNSDGAEPQAGLVLSGNTLYGTTPDGGINGNGTLFAVNTNISSITVLHSFSAPAKNAFGLSTNLDGDNPLGGLILLGNTLYGTASHSGTNGAGTVFAFNTNTISFAVRNSFSVVSTNRNGIYTNNSGGVPGASLIFQSNTLYGTAGYGGTNGNGTVFALNTNGTGYTVLHTFTALNAATGTITNSDGANPIAGLALSSNILYGATTAGGAWGYGTLFSVNTNGTGFTVLYTFTNGTDGAYPYGNLLLSSNILYGTAEGGGYWGYGTVFSITPNGTNFTILHNFTGNDDGGNPYAGLILSGNTLYGTAQNEGNSGFGTVFSINTNGTVFTVLHDFTDGSDGAYPLGGLVLSNNFLYGTTEAGGNGGNGTVFAVSISSLSSAPALSSPGFFSKGQFQITVNGSAGQNYTVQMSTNLLSTNWISLLVTNPAGSSFLFSDSSATNGARFYRVLSGQ